MIEKARVKGFIIDARVHDITQDINIEVNDKISIYNKSIEIDTRELDIYIEAKNIESGLMVINTDIGTFVPRINSKGWARM